MEPSPQLEEYALRDLNLMGQPLIVLAQTVSPEMLTVLKEVRQKAVIGFVGGSDLAKISEQLAVHGENGEY